jgi:hypothetical protein
VISTGNRCGDWNQLMALKTISVPNVTNALPPVVAVNVDIFSQA